MKNSEIKEKVITCSECIYGKYIEDCDTWYCEKTWLRREVKENGFCEEGTDE